MPHSLITTQAGSKCGICTIAVLTFEMQLVFEQKIPNPATLCSKPVGIYREQLCLLLVDKTLFDTLWNNILHYRMTCFKHDVDLYEFKKGHEIT